MEEIVEKIAGEITLSDTPGKAMKKWREVFKISQSELSAHLHISASTISDYESNRRQSPGIAVIKRFVNALVEIDKKRGGLVLKGFVEGQEKESFYEVKDFGKSVSLKELAEMLNATVESGAEKMETHIFGCTTINSIKMILETRYEDFIRIYSFTSQRALLFTNTGTGRSPLVAIRVTPIKPAAIILHNLKELDPLAVKLAKMEGIPLLTTKMQLAKIKEKLEEIK